MKLLVRTFFSLFLCLSFGKTALAQNNPDIKRALNWYFGSGAGLGFSSGVPLPITNSGMITEEACFTMSDTCGNLLFYGQEDTIYNKNHQMMVNGNLFGSMTIDQMICIPQPGNDSLYYIFYPKGGFGNKAAFYYAIVNIKSNGGLGQIVSKDNAIYGNVSKTVSNKCAAMRHCNGKDVWIISKLALYDIAQYDSLTTDLYAFLLSSSGLNTTPVKSNVACHSNNAPKFWSGFPDSEENLGGWFRFAPNGKIAGAVYYGTSCATLRDAYVEFYQFDNCTGIFSNPITIQLPFYAYAISFSPDNTKAYVSTTLDGNMGCGFNDTLWIRQFDVGTYNYAAIKASEKIITPALPQYAFMGMQLAPDGKIYVAEWDTSLSDLGSRKIGVINNPNTPGAACNYVIDQLYLGGKEHQYGLPSFEDSYFKSYSFLNCYSGIGKFKDEFEVKAYPNPCTETINLVLNGSKSEYDLIIYNILGQTIEEYAIVSSASFSANLSHLVPGPYFLRITERGSNLYSTIKLIKQ